MASRSSRTSSIPIPTAPVNVRNIENVISIPHSSSYNRTRVPSSSSLASPPSNSSLARSVPRSASLSVSRSSFRQQFEPRVIRAAPPAQDLSCPPVSPTSNRRASGTANSAQTASRQRALSTHSAVPLQYTVSAQAFPRPAYLENSAFRDVLVTDASPPHFPARKGDGTTSTTSRSYGATAAISSDSDDESISSPPPRPSSSSASTSSELAQTYKLPTRWNNEDRHQFLSVSVDGRDVIYNGSLTNGDKDGAAIRANNLIPSVCGIYYYEVEIQGKERKSHVSVGFAGPNVKNSRLPGWEPNSWGYHGDDGCSFAAEKTGTHYSDTYGTGDKIGCGIDFSTRRAFFTKNGQFLGHVFENVGKGIDLYPAIGLQHSQEIIRVNFGQEPFVFDIDSHVQQQKAAVWEKIMSTPIHLTPSIAPPGISLSSPKSALSEEDSKSLLNNLVLSYLVHHGYAKTVRAFQSQQGSLKGRAIVSDDKDVVMAGTSPVKQALTIDSLEDDIERRKSIVNAVARGDIDTAISQTREHHPAVLEAEAGLLLFKLRCRKFVELVLATTEMKKEIVLEPERTDKMASTVSANPASSTVTRASSIVEGDWLEDDMDMDVDDDASGYIAASSTTSTDKGRLSSVPEPLPHHAPSIAEYEAAINAAIEYGQAISDDYKSDPRPEIQSLFKQTFGILAWDKPLEAGNDVAAFVSKEARTTLANELNQAILKSQGRPSSPALETLFRHAAACITQLGILGNGSAAFADLNRELLEG